MLYTEELAKKLIDAVNDLDIKSIEEDKDYMFEVIATNATLDRDGEIILLDGWDTKNWMKNPAIIADHNYSITHLIGKGLKLIKKDGNMVIRGVFSKSNPLAELARQLYNEGILKTVSVGFLPKQRNAENWKIIEKAELLEVSFVAVPCNPTALSLDQKQLYDEAVQKGLIIEQKDEKEEETPKQTEECGCGCKQLLEHIKELHTDVIAIKSFIADGKAVQEEQEKLLEKKDDLQAVARAVGTALQKLKSLS